METDKTLKLSIVIPTRNRFELLKQCLHYLGQQTDQHFEVIVVNDGFAFMEPLPLVGGNEITIVSTSGSGAATARNKGASMAKAPIVMFLDDDMIIPSKGTLEIINFHKFHQSTVLMLDWEYPPDLMEKANKSSFGRFLIKHGFTTYRGMNNVDDWEGKSYHPVDRISSQALSMSLELFNYIGKYNNGFPFAGFEDSELTMRIKNSGIEILVDVQNKCYHDESDRLNVREWMERRARGSLSRRLAVQLGFNEFSIVYPAWKKILLSLGYWLKVPALGFVQYGGVFKFLDIIIHPLVDFYIAVFIHYGYTKMKYR